VRANYSRDCGKKCSSAKAVFRNYCRWTHLFDTEMWNFETHNKVGTCISLNFKTDLTDDYELIIKHEIILLNNSFQFLNRLHIFSQSWCAPNTIMILCLNYTFINYYRIQLGYLYIEWRRFVWIKNS